MKIKVQNLCGTDCVEPDDGVLLREKIAEGLSRGDKVELDFEGVSMLITAFLNVAIGSLYKDYDEILVDSLVYENIDSSDMAMIAIVSRNAKKFYGLSEEGMSQMIDQTDDLVED